MTSRRHTYVDEASCCVDVDASLRKRRVLAWKQKLQIRWTIKDLKNNSQLLKTCVKVYAIGYCKPVSFAALNLHVFPPGANLRRSILDFSHRHPKIDILMNVAR